MKRIGIYLGSNSDDISNISNVLAVWVKALSQAGHEIDLVGGTNIPERIREESSIQEVVDTEARTPFGKIKNSYDHISKYVSEKEPDLIMQIWKYQTHAPGVAIAGKLCGVPTIVRFTGDVFQEYRGYDIHYSAGVFLLANVVGSIPLFLADKVVALGPNLKASVQSRRVNKSDVHIISPPPPDKQKFCPVDNQEVIKDRLGLASNRPVALFVGRLTQQKGMLFLKKVMKSTLAKTDFQFVLVGEGPYRDQFRKYFSSEKVMLPGYIPRSQIAKYYQAASVYVHPSQYEGIPLVILEALQSGIPVVARDAGDVNFVINDIVKTEQQMVDHIVNRKWNDTWQNKKYFTLEYQQNAIIRLIESLEP